MKKRDEIDIRIEKIEYPNRGVGYVDGEKVIVKHSIPGQRLRAVVNKVKKGTFAVAEEILEKSPIEIPYECEVFNICGGCSYQNIKYQDEIKIKENMILELFEKSNIDVPNYLGIKEAPNKKDYRNKMEYSFGDDEKGGEICLGMRKRRAYYEVADGSVCQIADEDFRKIVGATIDYFRKTDASFYHKGRKEGDLRHLVVRKSFYKEEILINIVTTSSVSDLSGYVEVMTDLDLKGKLIGICHTVNNSVADAVKVDEFNVLYGRDYFMEKLLGLDFKITAFSFFQTNSQGAEELYTTVKEFAGDSKDKTIFDLYCGTGTIAQILSENAKKVVGIEIVEEAVDAAKENAELNNITNCEFISGNVLDQVDLLRAKYNPDLIVLDPPREGIHPKAIGKIIDFGAEEIVYVSCKPSSLVRDLEIFMENGYKLDKVKIHDMFPRTNHVETVVLMSIKIAIN